MSDETRSLLEDHLLAPRRRGALRDCEHAGAAGGAPCGDVVRIAVRLVRGRVAGAGFEARGCAAAQAAGSAVVELVEGASLLDAALVSPERVSAALGGLSPERSHAAGLAADALHRALGAAALDGAARLEPRERRTVVAMSGGVDSAVAARLALDAGHEVVGVTLELWSDPATDGTASCCSPQAVTGARALAHRMGMPHLTLDLRAPFRAEVVDEFVAEHRAGRTPNPCVRCNGSVRFDAMLRLAGDLGAPRLATGHYARLVDDGRGPLLRRAADPAKDQSYMLARLRPHELERLWFPLGELRKPRVRELARGAGLPVAERPESQDLCFLAGTRREAFLRRHARRPGHDAGGRPGPIVDREGTVLGRHEGQECFTVGQRRGLGLGGGEPLYVLRKDAAENRVVVGPRAALARRRVSARKARLDRDAVEVDGVRLRYRSGPIPARVDQALAAGDHDRLTLTLERPAEGIAPGQVACLMRGELVVGSATIEAMHERDQEPGGVRSPGMREEAGHAR